MLKTKENNSQRKKIQEYSYATSDKIGKGYSSQVYKGRNDHTNQEVAIKVIDMKMIKGETHKNLLQAETEVLKLFKKPENVIEVFDIYKTKDYTYIITEYCKDGDLSKVIKQGLSESEAVDYLKQIISGYLEICKKRIIHRDLKPANILIKDNTIKIADFGFATKQYQFEKKFSYNVGSPIYMPPESLNENIYSFKSDIWALGIIFYEMLTGKTPWRAKTEKDLGRMLKTIPIKKLLPKDISESSLNFLLKSLTPDPSSRISPYQLEEQIKSFPFELRKCKSSSIFKHLPQKSQNNREKHNQISFCKSSMKKLTKMNFYEPSADKENQKHESLPKTAVSIKNKTEKEMNIHLFDYRQISKELLSQIHFTRFTFKLSQRMRRFIEEDESVIQMRTILIKYVFHRLFQLKTLRVLDLPKRKLYESTQDYGKIRRIIDQYETKYERQTNMYKKQALYVDFTSLKTMIKSFIKELVEKVNLEEKSDVTETQMPKIIIIDYLITLKQLMDLQERGSISEFHQKSEIDKIVEGSPVKAISGQHLAGIMIKLQRHEIL